MSYYAVAPVVRTSVPLRLGAWTEAALAPQYGRLAPWLTVALGVGVLAYFARDTEPGLGVLALVPPLIGMAVWFLGRSTLIAWLFGLLATGLLGFGVAAWQATILPPPSLLPRTQVIVTGRVAEVQRLPEGVRLTLIDAQIGQGEKQARSIRIRLRSNDTTQPVPGQMVRVRAMLREPGAPTAPGAWDFQRSAFFSGLGGSGFALGLAELLPGEPGPAPPLAGLRALLDAHVAATIPGAAGAIAAALLTGTQSAIPPAEMAAMRDSGLAHLLSVSGLHMAIVMGVVFASLRLSLSMIPYLALRLPSKSIATVAALAAGAFYMVLTGSQVPMQRCFAMATFVTLALLAGRRALALRPIALAAAAVILLAPAEALGPSFQMSFAAVLALIVGHEAWRTPLSEFRQRHPGFAARSAVMLAGVVLTSMLAGAATAPFGLHHFGRLQVYGIVANALAVPLTSFLVMPAGLLAMLLMPLGLDALPLIVMGWGVEGILLVARWVAAWPGAAPAFVPLPAIGLALASFGFCWLCLWRGWLRAFGLPLIMVGLFSGQVVRPPDLLVSDDGRMVALRTDQGAFLYRLPGSSNFVRDAWARTLGVATFDALPEQGEVASGAISCTPVACRFRPRPDSVEAVLLRSPPPPRLTPGATRRGPPLDVAALAEACGHVALLVASEPIRPRCINSVSIDRFSVWRDGTHAAWLGDRGAVVVSDRVARGERPWVPPPPLPGRPEGLPLAPLDIGLVSR